MYKTIKNQKSILKKLSIEKLNTMQQEALLAIDSYSEIVLLSPTGTGKTLAFLLPIVAELKPDAIATFVGDKLGIPSELRTTPQEKEAIIQQSMQMMSAQSAMMQGAAPGGAQPTEQPQTQEPVEAVEEQLRS